MTAGSFPLPQDDDAEDVAWGLATGEVLWRQGDHLDAIVWLRRAASSALDAGQIIRSEELGRTAAALMAALEAGYFDEPQASGIAPPPAVPSVPFPLYRPPPASVPVSETEIDEVDVSPYSSARPEAPQNPGSWPPPPSGEPFTPAPLTRTLPGFQAAPSPPAAAPSTPPPGPAASHPVSYAPAPNVYAPPAGSSPPAARIAVPSPSQFPEASTFRVPSSPPGERARRRSSGPAAQSPSFPPAVSPAPAEPVRARTGSSRAPAARPAESIPPPFSLDGAKAFDDLAPRSQARLARAAQLDRLDTDEEMPLLGLAYVITGACAVEATVVDTPVARMSEKDAIYAFGTEGGERMSLRLVATADGTTVAHWDDPERVEDLFDVCPEALDRLKVASDRHQVLAGASMGPLGERLDEALMTMATERLELRHIPPGELLAQQGEPLPGIFIVGVGSIELERDGAPAEKLGPGDLLFATEILAGGAAPATARGGAKGAMALFGNRQLAHELLVSCPPLLEIFAGM